MLWIRFSNWLITFKLKVNILADLKYKVTFVFKKMLLS